MRLASVALLLLARVVSAQLDDTRSAAQAVATAPAAGATTAAAPMQLPPLNGPGLMMIDDDGDGYGVACPKGPDADDNDPQVNTPESAIKKHGSIEKLLAARGYKPQRILYIAPNGDDAAAAPDDPAKPFATFARTARALRPGDAVLFRQGTYKGQCVAKCSLLRGRADAPIILAAYPGERVVLDAAEACIELDSCSHVIVDGFVLDNSDKDREGRGLRLVQCSDVTARNCEVLNHFWGVMGMQDLHRVRLERLVIHDIPHEHGIYLGCRELPNSDLTVSRCVIYHCAQQGLQHNGRVKNFRVERCTIHSNGQAGLLLMQGVCDSNFAGNLIFNNSKQAIVIYNYDSTDPSILPFNQTGNVFEGNIVWVGARDWNKQYDTAQYPAVLFNESTGSKTRSFDGNVFRRNVICTSAGGSLQFNQPRFADKTIVQDNLLYRRSGEGGLLLVGAKAVGLAELNRLAEGSRGNVFKDPQFLRASDDDAASPEKFDFRCAPTSPAMLILQPATTPAAALPASPTKGEQS